MLQMGGVGPMRVKRITFEVQQGQSALCRKRYRDGNRLYSVLIDDRSREFLSGSYSIADMATWPWISRYEWQEIDLGLYPNLKRWYLKIADLPFKRVIRPIFVNGFHT